MMHSSAASYTSGLQIVRVLSERWLAKQGFCPSCSGTLTTHPNNHPAADFYCSTCKLDFELKSKDGSFGRKVVDGAYSTMLHTITSNNAPSLFLLSYKKPLYVVAGLQVIPGHFLHTGIIEPRKPLSAAASRAGWQGCNILLDQLPRPAIINVIRQGQVVSRAEVQAIWKENAFLRQTSVAQRGWLAETMKCVEALGTRSFSLEGLYAFEHDLARRHPKNNNIRAKLRQQLQKLRDQGQIRFLGSGKYEVVASRFRPTAD